MSAPWLPRALSGVLASVLVGGAAVAATHVDGFSVAELSLASGQAWVTSAAVGQISLIDGSTEEKVASVPVARAGDDISVVQAGPDAVVVNRTTGSLRRVLGSTYADAPGDVRPLPGARQGLSAYAGDGGTAYAVDAVRGAAVSLDRATMTPTRASVSLAARLDPASTVIDPAGRLWAVDSGAGDLVWFDRAGKHTRRSVASAAARLTLVRGEPAVVDPRARTVSLIDPGDGGVRRESCLDVAPGADLRVAGSTTSPYVFTAVPDRGVLLVSDLSQDGGACTRIVTIAAPGARLGTPVETGGRVFVPDYGAGRVYVVDVSGDQLIASAAVLPPGLRSFDLVPRDGFVFYNDPASQRAGVIRLDGTVRAVSKYDPRHSDDEVRRPVQESATGPDSPQGGGAGAGSDDAGGAGKGSSDAPEGGTGKTGSPDRKKASGPTPPPKTAEPPKGPGRKTGPPPANGPTELRISSTSPPYTAGAAVGLSVESTAPGKTLAAATWAFGDEQTGDGLSVEHIWATAGEYQLSVTGTFTDGTTATTGTTVTVRAPGAPPDQAPVPALTTTPATGPVGTTVTADASGSKDLDGTIVSYTVQWGDGGQSTRTTPTGFTHTYEAPCDACSIVLVVTDDGGLSASTTAPVTITAPPADQPPTAVLSVAPATIDAGQGVTADASSSTDDEPGLEYEFAWGDGATTDFSGDPRAGHTYDTAGSYQVTLTVRDSSNQLAQATAAVTVNQPPRDDPPKAALDVTPGSGKVDLEVSADATASSDDHDGASLSYSFDWGDGSTSTSSSGRAAHTYKKTCSCTVAVRVEDSKKQSDKATRTITVDPPTVHAQKSVILNQAAMWDLDEIENAFMNPSWEVAFGADDTNGATAVFDDDGIRAAKVGSASYNACAIDLPAVDGTTPMTHLKVGDVLCITTDQGRLSMVEILANDYSGRITTWDAP